MRCVINRGIYRCDVVHLWLAADVELDVGVLEAHKSRADVAFLCRVVLAVPYDAGELLCGNIVSIKWCFEQKTKATMRCAINQEGNQSGGSYLRRVAKMKLDVGVFNAHEGQANIACFHRVVLADRDVAEGLLYGDNFYTRWCL